MSSLRREEELGHLTGLQLPGLKSILYELFVDDTSLFIRANARDFRQARKVIDIFEKASGAQLDVQKSLVMALGRARHSNWLNESGCEVADHRRRFRFLGVWSGRDITQVEIAEKLTKSIDCRLRSWVNKHLTFHSRLLLIKHVLTAIQMHHLMSIGLDKKGLTRINRAVRQFLWGTAESGKSKTSLIAWVKLHLPKSAGGLEWTDLQIKMDAHLASNALRVLKEGDTASNWARIAHAIIRKHVSNGPKSGWSTQEVMLLSTGIRITGAPTLTRILSAWFRVKRYLHLESKELEIPLTLTYSQLETMLQGGAGLDLQDITTSKTSQGGTSRSYLAAHTTSCRRRL
ncbi:hypothetical protein R1sor_017365 [Riccia sorocarpa]|uniref:Reverse transcriptase domain-containing protein n=1 Tax=Riccia sorocarpa TaxID=122646 RepID=A0ABD3I6M9_9MARC